LKWLHSVNSTILPFYPLICEVNDVESVRWFMLEYGLDKDLAKSRFPELYIKSSKESWRIIQSY
jgi:hypothetical protein